MAAERLGNCFDGWPVPRHPERSLESATQSTTYHLKGGTGTFDIDEVDLNRLAGQRMSVVEDTVQSENVDLWLKRREGGIEQRPVLETVTVYARSRATTDTPRQ